MTDERRIMDERARLLARPIATTLAAAGAEALFFSLGAEQLAIEVRHVLEIAPLPELTPVPDLPAAFLGVVNHAGEILPVVDLGVLTSDRPTGPGATLMVVVGGARRELALAVTEVERITTIARPQPVVASVLIRDVLEGQRVLIDGDALLRDPRLFLTSASS